MDPEDLLISELSGLIAEVEKLSEELRSGQQRFSDPTCAVCATVFQFPLNYPISRLAVGDPHHQPAVVAGRDWFDHLRQYSEHVEQFYVARLNRPGELRLFPTVNWVLNGERDLVWRTRSGDICLAELERQRSILLNERAEHSGKWHGKFRQLLRDAILAADHDNSSAGSEMGIDRATVGDYLNGNTNDLKARTRNAMGKYIRNHLPHETERVRQLLGA
jgi:hypothetical protein